MNYMNLRPKGLSRIPLNIADLLTPVSLAYWIMDEGSYTGSGLRISTNNFSAMTKVIDLLINALERNFSIKATTTSLRDHVVMASRNVQYKEKSQYILYITKAQLPLVRSLVKDH